MARRPSIVRIVKVDLAAYLACVYPLLFWLTYGVMLLFIRERAADPLLIGALLATTVVGVLVVLWRVQLVLMVFADGVEAMATVGSVGFHRGGGHIAYTYPYQGQTLQGSNSVARTTRTNALKTGDVVTVLIDRHNPKRAFIRDLYLSAPA